MRRRGSNLFERAKYHRIYDFLRAAPPDRDGRNSLS